MTRPLLTFLALAAALLVLLVASAALVLWPEVERRGETAEAPTPRAPHPGSRDAGGGVSVTPQRQEQLELGELGGLRDPRDLRDLKGRPPLSWPSQVFKAGFEEARRFARSRGDVAFAVLGEDGQVRGYRHERGYPSASVVKAVMLVSYLQATERGELPWRVEDRALLRRMIVDSDNEAASLVYARLGDARLLETARRGGMRSFTVAGYWGDNRLTAADAVRFFWRLDALLASRASFARELLAAPPQRWGLPEAAEKAGWRVYFKGGWRGDAPRRLVHQAARLERGGEAVAVAVLTVSPSQAYGEATLSGVGQRLLGP